MWLKILSGLYTVAKTTGLDKKLKNWIVRKIEKSKNKYDDKALVAAELIIKVTKDN
jgi:hypothetical protein